MGRKAARASGLGLLVVLLLGGGCATAAGDEESETVHFPSADGTTSLVGYVFVPAGDGAHPALVLLHGRGGLYSSQAPGVYTAQTLSRRHQAWSRFWRARGYVVILVDSFAPRGYAAGFPRASYARRPAEVSEQTVRPLDAYGALTYLRTRTDVQPDRVGLQGWSNGGTTTLLTMSDTAPGTDNATEATGFRAAVVLYPGCGAGQIQNRYVPNVPLLMLLASVDDEASPRMCERFALKARAAGAPVELVIYEGAEHDFDDPVPTKQTRPANRRATEDAMARAERFFRVHLGS